MRPRFRGMARRCWSLRRQSCRAYLPSCLDPRHVEPFLLAPALKSQLGELHALRALEQSPAEWAFTRDMLQEELPLRLECVVIAFVGRFLPASAEVDRLGDIRTQ